MGSGPRKDWACVQPVVPTRKLVWAYPERITGQAVSVCRCYALYKTVPSSHNFSVLALAWLGLSPLRGDMVVQIDFFSLSNQDFAFRVI